MIDIRKSCFLLLGSLRSFWAFLWFLFGSFGSFGLFGFWVPRVRFGLFSGFFSVLLVLSGLFGPLRLRRFSVVLLMYQIESRHYHGSIIQTKLTAFHLRKKRAWEDVEKAEQNRLREESERKSNREGNP